MLIENSTLGMGKGYGGYGNIVITGIGGQGIVFAAQLLRRAVGARYGNVTGYDVRGGAQRYGHVAAVIRFDPGLSISDLQAGLDIPPGHADFVLSLEASEGLRFAGKIGRRTRVIMDRFTVIPTNVRRSGGVYPDFMESEKAYESIAGRVLALDLRKRARELSGRVVDANLLALGAMCASSGGLVDTTDFSWAATPREMDLISAGAELAVRQAGVLK